MAMYRYKNRKDDWVFTDAFQQVFDEAKQWIALYEKQRSAALNHCGSCWAQLNVRKNAKGEKTSYCPKGCKCTCNSNRSCVVHLECTCLTSWICEFHKTKRPDVAVALYNALPPNEPARLILVNSFAHEGIDQTKYKRRGRKPKVLKLADFGSPVEQNQRKQYSDGKVDIALVDAKHQTAAAPNALSELSVEKKLKPVHTETGAKADLVPFLEAKFAEYRNWLGKQQLSTHSQRNYLSRVSAFIEYLRNHEGTGKQLILENKDEPVNKLCAHLRSLNLKPATINSYLSAIDNFYAFLDLGKLKIDRNELSPQTPSVLSAAQQRKFLKAIETTRRPKDRAIAALLFYLGLKLTECAQLQISDLRLSGRKKVAIIRSGEDIERHVPLNSAVCEAIKEWLEERTAKYEGKTVSEALFLNPQGKGMLPNALYEVICKVGRECDLALSPHALRDTFIANLISNEKDALIVADIAGHKSVNTTKRYAEHRIKDRSKTLKRLANQKH